jgi:hypothetical protein
MMMRTLAALLVLAGSAWAQTEPAPQTAPAEAAAAVTEAAPAETTQAVPGAEVVAEAAPAAPAPAIPTDAMELVAYALSNAREAQQCRYAFSRLQTTAAQVGWSDAEAEAVIRFDPRLPIGSRWTVVRATRQQRAIQRAFAREDRKGLPFDLMALAVEGEWSFENIALTTEHPERFIYSYRPRVVPERAADETGVGIIEQLVGQIEVDRATGRVVTSSLREPPPGTAVRAMGIVRVHRALLHNTYATQGSALTESGSQMFNMSALLSSTEVTTSFRLQDVEPICDPAVVAEIEGREATARAASRR